MLMMRTTLLVLLGSAAVCLNAQTPEGWKTIKDKTGACQVSVPNDWQVSQKLPGMALAPDQSDAMILYQPSQTVKQMNDDVQRVLGVDKLFENTPQRVFWSAKPASYPKGAPPVIGYHVTVPGKGGTCVGQINARQDYPEDQVRKIAVTVSPAK
jgi:hypothetical protein